MTREEANKFLTDISYTLGNMAVEYLTEKDGEKMREAINVLTNEQQTCEDAVSRQAVEDKLLKLCNELEGIFANIRMQNQDDIVCGLCEYDCPAPYECPGFDREDCFKLAYEIRHKWQSTKDLPSVNPQRTGHWIYDRTRDWDGECKYECSECSMGSDVDYPYCMRCGAKMVEPQETETWNGIHAQITAPNGTFERIFNDADDDSDI